MIHSFSGDAFLSQRAAKRWLKGQGFARPSELEEITPETVEQAASQGGLFGSVALLLNFDEAFSGQSATKMRNAVIKVLQTVPEQSVIAVIDSTATAARQKNYAKFSTHQHQPTPKYNGLTQWVRSELQAVGLNVAKDVPQLIADIFGQDLPAIASEISKLSVLAGEEVFSAAQVRQLINRPASHDAFDLLEACAASESAKALAICRNLLQQGEAPPRILGALLWQYNLLAQAVALQSEHGRLDAAMIQRLLKVHPFVAKKVLGLARGIDEPQLLAILEALLEAELASKTGKDAAWALEALAISLALKHAK